ncbi:aminoacyl-tRNA hydrolase [Candidatus Deianiraea vastatrix]|uniref:Peptidyl-tRNA hydrolase n=1 Tax=Candidatus Deianiraea vastatrix TaxID=2163644 RepID=A0A5B8XCL7_9RICK|nr:aminoacyl-tRNA hydrolase [Candidatus Deianiraea vastatrix]QED23109.1 Peptidyl-tRNA hydrolase [Candidatus Deianiraea vastatrix]
MFLVVGLGNPGNEYKNTRHNIGFIAIDKLVSKFSDGLLFSKFDGLLVKGRVLGSDIIFLKPQTYMNLSGNCVQRVMQFYKIQSDKIIVIHDDIDLKFGVTKMKFSGGNGGHNGLKSIDATVGSNYHRIRVGVGRPENKDMVSSYVLSNFSASEIASVDEILLEIENKMLEKIQDNSL